MLFRNMGPGDFKHFSERHREGRWDGVELLKDLHRVLKNSPPPLKKTPPFRRSGPPPVPLTKQTFLRTLPLFLRTLPLFSRNLLLFIKSIVTAALMHPPDSHRVSLNFCSFEHILLKMLEIAEMLNWGEGSGCWGGGCALSLYLLFSFFLYPCLSSSCSRQNFLPISSLCLSLSPPTFLTPSLSPCLPDLLPWIPFLSLALSISLGSRTLLSHFQAWFHNGTPKTYFALWDPCLS